MKNWGNASLALLICMSLGCSEDVKHQDTYRGRWKLESRQPPTGEKLVPPAIAGVLEWFPLSEARAHVTVMLSMGEDDVNLTASTYTLEAGSFVRDEFVRIGDGYVQTPWSADAIPTRSNGTSQQGSGTEVIVHGDGTRFSFEAEGLTVTRSDGTVDRWTREVDIPGALAN